MSPDDDDLVDDCDDEPCEPNIYGFCRWCGRDMGGPNPDGCDRNGALGADGNVYSDADPGL